MHIVEYKWTEGIDDVQVCVELEEEKSKHARDMEQGDNVTYMLEKDRERLKQEVGLFALR